MPVPYAQWRLIVNPKPVSGPLNMAIDEAIFELNDAGSAAMPTLRLYAWYPPCLSLGISQPVSDIDLAALAARGWDLVRRPTGGRAILHADELTYSVIGSTHEPRLAGSVLESYRRLAQALLYTLQTLGLQVDIKESGPTSKQPLSSAVCFEVPSNYEITSGGKKILGSAQARRKNNLLQHGSLPLTGNLTRITESLKFEDETLRRVAAQRLLQHAVTVEMVLGKPVHWEQAARAMIQGFEKTLNIGLVTSDLTPQERELADKLYREKYSSRQWTHHV